MLRKALFSAVPLCLGAIVCVNAPAQGDAVAHVLDVRGEWRVDGTLTGVTAGQALQPGARIGAVSNQPGDAITIVRDEDMARQHVACDSTPQNPCRNPIVIATAPVDSASGLSRMKGMVQAALAVLLSKPPEIGSHYAMTLSRGADPVRELEDVASFDAKGVTLPPLPQDFEAGTYTLRIALANQKSPAVQRDARLNSEGVWPPIALSGPGLYDITITNADEEKIADMMLLVVPGEKFARARQSFEEAKAIAADWRGSSAEADAHLFQRAFLLAESQQ